MNRQSNDFEDKNTVTQNVTEPPKKKKRSALKIFGIIGIIVTSVLLIIAIVLGIMIYLGRNAALADNEDAEDNISFPSDVEVDSDLDANYIYYNGKKYEYNDKVTTIMFAGIDKTVDEQIDGVFGTAGQADCIFVMALNTESGDYKLMAVSRDTMVDVNILDSEGNFQGTEQMQLCLAYAYGDGKEGSCENLISSVSRVFFGLPINSYVSVDLDAIPVLNDAVGGVTVEVIEDLSGRDSALAEGETVTLTGDQAEIFVRSRDVTGDENQNNLRMERQRVYLTGFIKQAVQVTKEDITTPISLYNDIYDYMVTNIDISMVTYYASIFLKSGFSAQDNMLKVPGTTVGGEKYAEYYTDTDEFFKIILEIYYKEVD